MALLHLHLLYTNSINRRSQITRSSQVVLLLEIWLSCHIIVYLKKLWNDKLCV